MKKTPRKLVLRRETLRALATVDLARAVGGLDSADARCLAAATTDTGAAACPTTLAATTDTHDAACPTTLAAATAD